jgi:hypothetical protein
MHLSCQYQAQDGAAATGEDLREGEFPDVGFKIVSAMILVLVPSGFGTLWRITI